MAELYKMEKKQSIFPDDYAKRKGKQSFPTESKGTCSLHDTLRFRLTVPLRTIISVSSTVNVKKKQNKNWNHHIFKRNFRSDFF